ncbi:MAG: DUF354 domain-containing protein [Promethearchaeota archaeon]
MSLQEKKIWIDVEEPKTAVMFQSLFKRFKEEKAKLLITARDYDATLQILNHFNIEYKKVGKHGGASLKNKLQAYIHRLVKLFPMVTSFNPDFFLTFSSVEGARLAFGLNIPSVGFNDEPRNQAVCKLILPILDTILIPSCVPIQWYLDLGASKEKLLPYNGIDEIAWLWDYVPNSRVLKRFNLKRKKYIILRTEPSQASYFLKELSPNTSLISEILPKIYEHHPDLNYLIIARNKEQEKYLKAELKNFLNKVIITQFFPSMLDLCFHAALVISGGGTLVREASLMNTPCIEFFPGDTAPQERFLINNGYPLAHIKEPKVIISHALEILSKNPISEAEQSNFQKEIRKYENPNFLCFDVIKKKLTGE